MPTALLTGYPHHVRAIARFVNQYASRWKIIPEGVKLGARNRALSSVPFVDALVAFGGPAPDAMVSALVRRRKKPIAVVWAGSDVLEVRGSPDEIARIRTRGYRHVACSAALANELCELGIEATELRLVVAEPHLPMPPLPPKFSVLAYAPNTREYLYGVDILLELTRRLPQIHFDIIGGFRTTDPLPNVSFHGWLDDVTPMIDASTVVVRPTRHDGMPLVVLEALARGRYAIWSQQLEGTILGASADEIAAELTALHRAHETGRLGLNEAGVQAITKTFSPLAVTSAVETFLDDLVASSRPAKVSSFALQRRRGVVSGAPEAVAGFLEQVSREAPHWSVHALVGRSRSERLDDMVAMVTSERWFKIGNGRVDPIVGSMARMLRKEAVGVKFEPGKPLNGAMKTERRRFRRIKLTPDEWHAFDACHPAPTFFARPAWAMALERAYYGFSAEPTLFRLPEGEALLPLIRSGRRFVEIQAMPLGTYTLPLTPDGTAADPMLASAIVRQIIGSSSDDFSCTLWPLADYQDVGECQKTPHQAAVIDLRDGAEAALARFKGVARRMAGQALRKGVTVSREPDAMGVYYGLLEESAKRWGLAAPHLSRTLFDAIQDFGGDDVEVWIARYQGEAIAGGVMLYGSEEAFFWSAAMRADYSSLRPSNLLNAEMIKASVERGMKWYNLGASEGLGGVERFKESLGAELVDYATLSWKSSVYRQYQKIRTALDPKTRAMRLAT
jgi:glycosyltransferase involved in cell wall biosynthesis